MLACIYRYAFRHILGFFTLLFCPEVRNMFHDQRVFTNGMYLPFCFFMSCLKPPIHISSVGSFPVWSGGSLILFLAL